MTTKKGENKMAASKLKFNRTITDKLTVKGMLNEEGTAIIYEDELGDDKEARISDLLNAFKNCNIEFSVGMKSDEALDVVHSENTDEE